VPDQLSCPMKRAHTENVDRRTNRQMSESVCTLWPARTGDEDLRDYERAEAVHHALIPRMDARMTAWGWHADPTANLGIGDGVVGRFRYPLNKDFAATVWFAWLGDFPPLQVDTAVGVSYQRSGLLRALCQRHPTSQIHLRRVGDNETRL
jgi:hypothetical protein